MRAFNFALDLRQEERLYRSQAYVLAYITIQDGLNVIQSEIAESFKAGGRSIDSKNISLRLFQILRDIIAYDRKFQSSMPIGFRRANLLNIAHIAELISYGFSQIYQSRVDGFSHHNIWRDLAYFETFDLYTSREEHHPSHSMSDRQVIAFLEGEMTEKLDEIAEAEINGHCQEHRIKPQEGFVLLSDWIKRRRKVRLRYQDSREFEPVFSFIVYHRELSQVRRAITYLKMAIGLVLGGADAENNRKALLRCLLNIGETATGKNLTPPSKALALNPAAWKLLIEIRNKLAHSEWDIYPGHTEALIRTGDFSGIHGELTYLLAAFTGLQSALIEVSNKDGLKVHYSGTAVLAPSAAPASLGNLRRLLASLPQNEKTMKRDMCHHAAIFHPAEMISRICQEVDELNKHIRSLNGEQALEQAYSREYGKLESYISFEILVKLLQINMKIANDLELAKAIVLIFQHYEKYNEPVVLEMPSAVIERIDHCHINKTTVDGDQLEICIYEFYPELVDRLKFYAKRLPLYASLRDHPEQAECVYYHIARIGEFLELIPKTLLYDALGHLSAAIAKLIRGYRQHGGWETIEVKRSHFAGFVRDARVFARELAPALELFAMHGPAPAPS